MSVFERGFFTTAPEAEPLSYNAVAAAAAAGKELDNEP